MPEGTSKSFDSLVNQLATASDEALAQLGRVDNTTMLEDWYKAILGRKGSVQLLTRQVGQLATEERPLFGKQVNKVKQSLEVAYEERSADLRAAERQAQISGNGIDVTLPGRQQWQGRLHPVTQTLRDVYRIWGDMGFQIYRSPDVETDEYNFERLNIPAHHPARDMWDTFYTQTEGVVLRTHTSPGQIHAMQSYAPEPIRIIVPGMVYRYEQISARKESQFHQIEGLAIGKNINFADLKGTLTEFTRRFFGASRNVRFRGSYFPFTEPSAEVDVECVFCDGKGCQLCKYTGWLEILGSGMVHPNVLRNGGYDPEVFSGFAFGVGTERITMLKYNVEDIRHFWSNDLRFLQQF